jgi:hypothetical protein
MEIVNSTQLKEAIFLLEAEKEEKKFILIEQFHETYESLKPVNLIKQTFNKLIDTPDIANQVLDTSIGLGAGVLSKKILVGKSTNIFKRFFGTIIELTVANAVSKNSDGIKKHGLQLIKKLIK